MSVAPTGTPARENGSMHAVNPTGRSIDPAGATGADQEAYKDLSSTVAKGVAVVTAFHRGWNYAAVVTDYLSVSYDPPTMLLSLYSLSRMVDAIEETEHWALSILSSKQGWIADQLAQPGAPLVALLDQIPHTQREAAGPALIDGALAWFELRNTAAHEAATHTLFVGEVAWMGRDNTARDGPLVRFRAEYNRFQTDVTGTSHDD